MDLMDIVLRSLQPIPWEEGDKIPWHEPEFSRRMLQEHLSQKHDAASRRSSLIKKHVNWINNEILEGKPSRILDLGCGPGLYTQRLARLGHSCEGIDFSPAAIEYAVGIAQKEKLNCSYRLEDIRTAEFGRGFDLVMLIFGEFNVFHPQDADRILKKSSAALKPGGILLLEVLTYEAVMQLGEQPALWYSAESELFSDQPHLCLMEGFWDETRSVATERYFIVNAASGQVTRYVSSTQAYELNDFNELLGQAGYRNLRAYPSLSGKEEQSQSDLFVITAQKQE